MDEMIIQPTNIEAVSVSGGLGRHDLSMSDIAAVQFPAVPHGEEIKQCVDG